MFHASPARWLAVFPAMAALAAAAQPASPASAQAIPAVPAYRSAFEGYQGFADGKPIPWKQANETVHQRGGWRGYAKEASDAPATANQAPASGAHAGHAMPMPMPARAHKAKP